MGPKSLGRACCNTCSGAEIDANQGREDYVFYHDQEYDNGKNPFSWLGWSGSRTPQIIANACNKQGLTFEWDADENRKFFVSFGNLSGQGIPPTA